MIEKYLAELGFSADETKTYLLLLEVGASTAGTLAKRAGIPRPSLYGFLQRLSDRGVITQTIKDGVKIFIAQHPSVITKMFGWEIERLSLAQKEYQKLASTIEHHLPTHFLSPKFRLFEGAQGVQHILKDMLLYSNIETQAYWPIKTMIDLLSPDFFKYLNTRRIRNHLYTRAIWPTNQQVKVEDHPYLGVGGDFQREIRIAPKHIDFSMGYWIYGNNVAFVSSRKESFGFIIESPELATMLLSQFEIIWKLSKPLKVNSENTNVFLREMASPMLK